MKLYHLTQETVTGYDTYSDCVVVAPSREAAQQIHPNFSKSKLADAIKLNHPWIYFAWPQPDQVTVTYIGEAATHLIEGTVICASFHAG